MMMPVDKMRKVFKNERASIPKSPETNPTEESWDQGPSIRFPAFS